jgi:hypothetical protein
VCGLLQAAGFGAAVADIRSFSAAYVAAAAALRLSVSPHWHLEEVRSVLRASAAREARTPFSIKGGYGRLNLPRVLTWDAPVGVRLLTPEHHGLVSGWVDIAGLVRAPEEVTYELSYGVGDAPASWKVLGSERIPPETAERSVGDWQTKDVTDGVYTIRLAVTDDDGAVYEDRRVVCVNNASTARCPFEAPPAPEPFTAAISLLENVIQANP